MCDVLTYGCMPVVFQKVAYQALIGHLLHAERPCFAA